MISRAASITWRRPLGELVAVDVDVVEVVVEADQLQLAVGVEQRLRVPEPDVREGRLVALDGRRVERLRRRERPRRDARRGRTRGGSWRCSSRGTAARGGARRGAPAGAGRRRAESTRRSPAANTRTTAATGSRQPAPRDVRRGEPGADEGRRREHPLERQLHVARPCSRRRTPRPYGASSSS